VSRRRARRVRLAGLAAALVALAAGPPAAFGHAALLREAPTASQVLTGPPSEVALTYSEPIAPRFAIVSVTDADGHQVTSGDPRRGASAATVRVPLKALEAGWYLVYWRVISADGHPVRGAFTFAVGPGQGPAPQFVIPSLSESAATTPLVAARFLAFLTLLVAIGLVAFRLVLARPLLRRVPGASLRVLDVAALAALAAAFLVTLVYLELSTAQFALRSSFDVADVVPLVRDSSFGRGLLALDVALALLALATAIALSIDRPERDERSIAELAAALGVAFAVGACLVLPGLAGHPSQTSPAGLALTLDAVHLLAASLWLGGLAGITLLAWRTPAALRVRALAAVVPRFSQAAFASVVVIVASGTGAAILHLPTLATLWDTSYGKALLLKIGLLALALPLASLNLARTRPRLESPAAPDDVRHGAVQALRGLVGGELVLVAGIVAGAALLSSLPPPPKALASVGKVEARVGPGAIRGRTIVHGPYRVTVAIGPNQAAVPNDFAIHVERGGKPVTGADVTVRFTMLDMEMGQLSYTLPESAPGTYRRSAPALVMVGHWGLDYEIAPRGAAPFDVVLIDRAGG
jgi:copper transport protein